MARLHPFDEVVDGDDGVFVLSWHSRELSNDVHTLFSEGSWDNDATQRSRWLSRDVGEALTLVAVSDQFASIFLHGRQ